MKYAKYLYERYITGSETTLKLLFMYASINSRIYGSASAQCETQSLPYSKMEFSKMFDLIANRWKVARAHSVPYISSLRCHRATC